MNILIVEDSMIYQYIARDTLLRHHDDCTISFASNGELALEEISHGKIDLILLDIIMPKITGLEVLSKIKDLNLQYAPKIIMLTTISDSNTLKACFDLGAIDYIRKPFEEMDFISRVNAVLREISNEKKLNQSAKLLEKQNAKLIEVNNSLKEAQYHLVQKEKLVAIGELAAGIAHEINNPLAFVMSNFSNIEQYIESIDRFLTIIKEEVEMDRGLLVSNYKKKFNLLWMKEDLSYILDDFPELLSDSHKGLERVAKIVNSMRNFTRVSNDDSYEYVDINELFEEVIMIVNNEVKYIATIKKEYGDCPLIYCNKGQLEQVLVNIIINAAHAIKLKTTSDHGLITIKTAVESENCCISLCDNGIGIEQEHLNKIFNPFFTTKPVGQGTGLGLSISHSIIVEEHKGTIKVHSEVDHGSCFEIRIPFRKSQEII